MKKRATFSRDIRAEQKDDDKRIITGYPILFDEVTDRVGFYKEKIDRQALDNVDLENLYLVVGHNFDNLLARNGVNMEVEVDDKGLWFRAELGDTDYDKLIYDRVQRGLLDGMSFSFTADKIETDYDNEIDTIKRISNLYEITLTPMPAYPQTVATADERNKEYENSKRNLELEKIKKELEEL